MGPLRSNVARCSPVFLENSRLPQTTAENHKTRQTSPEMPGKLQTTTEHCRPHRSLCRPPTNAWKTAYYHKPPQTIIKHCRPAQKCQENCRPPQNTADHTAVSADHPTNARKTADHCRLHRRTSQTTLELPGKHPANRRPHRRCHQESQENCRPTQTTYKTTADHTTDLS